MQTSDSRKRAAEGDGVMVQVPAELVEALREAERHYRMTHAGEFANSLEKAARALVDAAVVPESTEAPEMAQGCDSVAPSGIPTPTVPRIARSIDDLRAGMTVAWLEPKGGKWWVCQSYDETDGWDWTGTEVILSEPPAPTLPTTPGSAAWMEWVHDKPINQGDGPARAAFIAGYEAAREANDGNV